MIRGVSRRVGGGRRKTRVGFEVACCRVETRASSEGIRILSSASRAIATYLLAQRRDACDVGDVIEDARPEGRLRERGDGVQHVRARTQRHFFKSRGRIALAQVASFPVASGPAGKRSAVDGEEGRAGDRLVVVPRLALSGSRVVMERSIQELSWKRTYLLYAFGELKHRGVGDRAPAKPVRCALPASPIPCPPSARDGAMGDKVLAKSKKGDNDATCEWLLDSWVSK